MKCFVCGKDYEANDCPRCLFPNVQVIGDRETAIKNMLPTIIQYRKSFAGTVSLYLVTYRWKDQNGHLVLDKKELTPLGTAEELMQSEKWLENKFARIDGTNEITVTVCIKMGSDEKELTIAVPNLKKPELQQLGVHIDNDFNLILLLSNDTEANTTSQPVDIFAG